jgi:trehalose-6-phosphate synthase
MPLVERRERWLAMVDNVKKQDVAWWRARFAALLAGQDSGATAINKPELMVMK